MAELSAQEQLLIELVNRARLDPAGEAARFGVGLNSGVPANQAISSAAKQPLAGNELLGDAARLHSQFMIDNDEFAHQGIGDGTPQSRMTDAGYVFTGSFMSGENIAIVGTTGAVNLTTSTVDMHENLFLSVGHRINMLLGGYRELGTGVESGDFPFLVDHDGNAATPKQMVVFNAVDATENFATSGTDLFVTGVAYDDLDGDRFYDVGEANAGITVEIRRTGVLVDSDTTATAGGYAVGLSAGACEITFTGGGLAADVVCSVNTQTAGGNVKVDLLGDNQLLSSADIVLGAGAVSVRLLGVAGLDAEGNDQANVIDGNKGANVLDGMFGNDTVRGFGGNDVLRGNLGVDRLVGGAGRDVLTGGTDRDIFDFDALSESGKTGSTRDRITDFKHLTDDIDLSTLDARTTVAGNNAFSFIGKGAFTKVAGQLHYLQQNLAGTASDKTIVEGDVNGDGNADFTIELAGIVTLTAADFLL